VNDPVNLYDPTGKDFVCAGWQDSSAGINDASNPCALGDQVEIGPRALTVAEWDDVHPQLWPHPGFGLINGMPDFSDINWDTIFALAPPPTNVDVLTLKDLLVLIAKNPALILLYLSINDLNKDEEKYLPPDRSRCPDAAHFNDPTTPPHPDWTWKGGDGSVPGEARGAWVSP